MRQKQSINYSTARRISKRWLIPPAWARLKNPLLFSTAKHSPLHLPHHISPGALKIFSRLYQLISQLGPPFINLPRVLHSRTRPSRPPWPLANPSRRAPTRAPSCQTAPATQAPCPSALPHSRGIADWETRLLQTLVDLRAPSKRSSPHPRLQRRSPTDRARMRTRSVG